MFASVNICSNLIYDHVFLHMVIGSGFIHIQLHSASW